ncbi:MAG: hypothetical protein HY717_04900 [Planctomycetes bacterium]|nr:hypothetical protein [Planctomycetota bacterium]
MSRSHLAAFILVGLVLSLLAEPIFKLQGDENSSPPAPADDPMKDQQAEELYEQMASPRPAAASEWLRIGEWCLQKAGELSPDRRALFFDRGKECIKTGRAAARQEVEKLVGSGEERIRKAPDYARALAAKEEAESQFRQWLSDLLIQFSDAQVKGELRASLEKEIERLQAAFLPLQQKEYLEKIRSGLVPLRGGAAKLTWISGREASGQYAGFQPLDKLAAAPGDYDGRLVMTEMRSHGGIYQLPGLTLLDGFDPKGGYLVPNFMEGRLVVSIPAFHKSLKRKLSSLGAGAAEAPGAEKKTPPQLFRMVLKIGRQEMQSTSFFLGEIQDFFWIDRNGNFISYYGVQGEEIHERRS